MTTIVRTDNAAPVGSTDGSLKPKSEKGALKKREPVDTIRRSLDNEPGMTPKVVDLFCGAGGLTRGFVDEGFVVVAGIDVDPAARFPYERNNDSVFLYRDVASMTGDLLEELFAGASHRILAGCAPCQPFSSYTQGLHHDEDERWKLLLSFSRLIDECRPEIVTMENVTRLQSHPQFSAFVQRLKAAGYHVTFSTVACCDYGVPQTRRRLVLLASLLGQIDLIPPTHKKHEWVTVRQAIGGLQPIRAGTSSRKDSLHRASGLTNRNMMRIQISVPGGSWKDWPKNMRTACHKKKTCKSYVSVYGRMKWDELAPTLTTQFFGIGHGRFGHPTQSRAISLREGAILQTFPSDYIFSADRTPSFATIGRLIGNAVPVKLSQAVARSIRLHLEAHCG